MQVDRILTELESKPLLELPPEGLEGLLTSAGPIREADTHVAGLIRIFELQGRFVVQEQLPDGSRVLVRAFDGRESAEAFFKDRLDTYDRMWDGCGCKVDYYG